MNVNQSSKLIFMTAVILSLILLPEVKAQPEGRGYEGRKIWGHKISEIHEQLGLTPDQKAQLKSHREKHRSQMEALHQQIKTKREQFTQELQKENFDLNKVKQIHSELKSLKAQMEDYRLDGILQVRQILTPEQFHKFRELKNQRKEHGKKDTGNRTP